MEFGSDSHHHRHEEKEEDEEEEGSEEMLILNNKNMDTNVINNNHINTTNSSSLNRVKMVEALSQVQIHPSSTLITTTTSPSSKPRYRECLRNHAINVMGHALDGCGEFMPGGPEGSVEALKCAACGCHRNFHRKEEAGDHTAVIYSHHSGTHSHLNHSQQNSTIVNPFGSYYQNSTPSGYLHLGPPRPLALPSASGGGRGSQRRGEEDQDDMSNPNGIGVMVSGMMRNGGKKRFRTKFMAEQKERMLAMAERIGWRIQKCDDDLVQQFCQETGVKRHVFKVWMHNNKHTLGKSITTTTTTTSSNLNINNNSSSSNNTNSRPQHHHQETTTTAGHELS